MSGEFGHINVDPGGPLCVCGKRGCLEAVAAVPAILNGARRMIAYGRASFLSELCDHQPDQLTIEMISQAAEQQDPVARDLLSHSADRLAQGITTYASLFDISHFIIGGEVIDTGEAYFGLLELALRKYCRDDLKVEILRAQLEKNAFLRGISMLTLQEVLRDQLGRFR
jgi:glucokinase